jgi:hypothetical protein
MPASTAQEHRDTSVTFETGGSHIRIYGRTENITVDMHPTIKGQSGAVGSVHPAMVRNSAANAGAMAVIYGSAGTGLTATDNQFWTLNSPGLIGRAEERDSFWQSNVG